MQIQQIKLSQIAPDSSVNVRRLGIGDNVEKVKASIQEQGCWPEMAVVVRPHPDQASEYTYEHVTGQCRFKACLELGLEEIPALVLNLSDDESIRRSWAENEARGDLTSSDRSYWVEKIYKRYDGDGCTGGEAIQKAADFFGVTVSTVKKYYSLGLLPEELKEMVDKGILSGGHASVIVKGYDGAHVQESQETMKERASWILSLDRDDRKHAVESIKNLGHKASIEDLNKDVAKRREAAGFKIEYLIPQDLHGRFLEWGKARGLKNETAIIGHMVTDVLKGQK